jgi:hypothetical protein
VIRTRSEKSQEVFDSVRGEWVAATPEEIVRQKLIHFMIEELGYPKHFLSVEKTLKEVPHLQLYGPKIPDRRADIICFAKEIHPQHALYPLLVVECTSVKITEKVLNQVEGYNHYLKSCFVAVANEEELRTGWFDPSLGKYQYVDFFPKYSELKLSVSTSLVEK